MNSPQVQTDRFANRSPRGSSNRFSNSSVVRHIKSGGLYVIVMGPDLVKIESNAEAAYAYRGLDGDGSPSGPVWVRGQVEMEDGRFEQLHDPAHSPFGFVPPSVDDLLTSPKARYEAEFVAPKSAGLKPTRWDCSEYLVGHFTLAEFWEILENPDGSAMSDGLRHDPKAPAWIREWGMAGQEEGIVKVSRLDVAFAPTPTPTPTPAHGL